MKVISFFYYDTYRFMQRKHPDKEPHKATLSEISMPIGIFIGMFTLLILAETDIWWYIVKIWDPDLAEPGRYNTFAPSSVLAILAWFFTSRILNWYFKQPNRLKDLEAYYLPYGTDTKTYDTLGRCLIFFFILGSFLTLGLYLLNGIYGFIPLVLILIVIELWIRYEFQWSVKKEAR